VPRLLLLICCLAFISLGLPDTLLGVAWPSVRNSFELKQSDISWLLFGSGCSYLLSSFFAGRLLKSFNLGVLLAASSGLVALSAFDYSFAKAWQLFALGSLLHGLGSGAIDSGLNHYAATHFSARHMNWMHACYGVGAMLGPLVMTAAIVGLNSWRAGYWIVAALLVCLSTLFLSTKRHWNSGPAHASDAHPHETVSAGAALKNRTLQLHLLLFFVYTGLEVAIGQWSFTVLTEARKISPEAAGAWVTIYWSGILAGRVGLGFIADRVSIDALIRASMLVAALGAALFAWNPAPLAAPVALALCGLGLAVIFPCLMTRTPQRLGKALSAHAIGFQVGAAMLGAAALPSLAGWMAHAAGLAVVPLIFPSVALLLLVLHEFVLARKEVQ